MENHFKEKKMQCYYDKKNVFALDFGEWFTMQW